MGCFQSKEARQSKQLNDEINRQIKLDKKNERKEIKLLLLGTGESGKSTVLRQIRIIHGGGYSREDRLATREVIFSNSVQSMKIIVEASKCFEIQCSEENQVHFELMANLKYQVESDNLPKEISEAIKHLWADAGIQKCFARSREYQLNDSAKYYFNHIDRISKPDFLPTDEDILHSRVKTTGIVESTFDVEGQNYRIYDVGGQRSERKKWIHCFENVTALFFIVPISEYDQKLVEDETTNRMREALELFKSISSNFWFNNTSIILFLNKIDLFNEKVRSSKIEDEFPEFKLQNQENIEQEGYEFFKSMFLDIFEKVELLPGKSQRRKDLYVFPTCATDTNGMRNIISSVNQIIVQANLEDCGLL